MKKKAIFILVACVMLCAVITDFAGAQPVAAGGGGGNAMRGNAGGGRGGAARGGMMGGGMMEADSVGVRLHLRDLQLRFPRKLRYRGQQRKKLQR